MDVVLNDLRENVAFVCAELIAYADDLTCVIKVNTRAKILTHEERIMEILTRWCNSNKLKISDTKTVAIKFKENLDESRLTATKINGNSIKFVEKVKYLGVIIDKKNLVFWTMLSIYEQKLRSTSA